MTHFMGTCFHIPAIGRYCRSGSAGSVINIHKSIRTSRIPCSVSRTHYIQPRYTTHSTILGSKQHCQIATMQSILCYPAKLRQPTTRISRQCLVSICCIVYLSIFQHCRDTFVFVKGTHVVIQRGHVVGTVRSIRTFFHIHAVICYHEGSYFSAVCIYLVIRSGSGLVSCLCIMSHILPQFIAATFWCTILDLQILIVIQYIMLVVIIFLTHHRVGNNYKVAHIWNREYTIYFVLKKRECCYRTRYTCYYTTVIKTRSISDLGICIVFAHCVHLKVVGKEIIPCQLHCVCFTIAARQHQINSCIFLSHKPVKSQIINR